MSDQDSDEEYEGNDIVMAGPAEKFENVYAMRIIGSTEEPLLNVSLMSIADAIADTIGRGFKIDSIEMKKVKTGKTCPECGGEGSYWTEWSDKAEADPVTKSNVLQYPDPPDGTVLYKCHVCAGTGKVQEVSDGSASQDEGID